MGNILQTEQENRGPESDTNTNTSMSTSTPNENTNTIVHVDDNPEIIARLERCKATDILPALIRWTAARGACAQFMLQALHRGLDRCPQAR